MKERKKETERGVFVPVTKEVYGDYKLGKEWEIRVLGNRFTEEWVYEGRPIKVRMGYSVHNDRPVEDWQLVGVIGQVMVGSLEEIFGRIEDYRLVEPRAGSIEDAVAENRKMLGVHPKYIAFQVIFDQLGL